MLKRMVFQKLVTACIAVMCLVGTAWSQTAAATVAPGGIPREQVPQFIIIGSDDNTNAEAMRWMADVISNGTNRDGSNRYMTFYVNTRNSDVAVYDWETNEGLVQAALHAYILGHSIGNHTDTHIRSVSPFSRMGVNDIYADIRTASKKMIAAGIPKEHQFGFRTPFLSYSDSTYTAMNRVGFMYDASMNAAGEPGAANFPYTLDAGTGAMAPDALGNIAPDNRGWWGGAFNPDYPNGNPIREHKGLWTIPISQVQIDLADQEAIRASFPPDCFTTEPNCYPRYILGPDDWAVGLVGGLDYNMWMEAKLDSGQTVRALMHTLRTTLAGNRAPISLGFHSQYYVGGTNYGMTEQQRKGLFEEFVRQASQIENVFFVSGDMVIRWMQNPVPASEFDPDNYRYCRYHNWSVRRNITPATCATNGITREECSRVGCGAFGKHILTNKIPCNNVSCELCFNGERKKLNEQIGNLTDESDQLRQDSTDLAQKLNTDTLALQATIAQKDQIIDSLNTDKTNLQGQVSTLTSANTKLQDDIKDLEDEIEKLLEELKGCGKVSNNVIRSDNRHGIKFTQNIVADKAEISVILPNNEKAVETKIAIYDITGNVVFSTTAYDNVLWDLRNSAGRFVANGTYLVIAEVKDRNGRIYQYSAKLGVKR